MTKHEQIEELVAYGFRQTTVSTWSEDRISTVLSARRRDERLALLRSDAKAAQIDGTRLGRPNKVEREVAARYLEEVLHEGGVNLVQGILYIGHCLTDEEAAEFATWLIAVLRGKYDSSAF